ncbi:hypothetical protein ACFLUX_01385 [Chloroflexota bacterium]
MTLGMEEKEIKDKVEKELQGKEGKLSRFDHFQIHLIANAISSVIIENNAKIQYSLGETGIDFK